MDKKVIHSVFEEVVKRNPSHLAIKTEDIAITYNSLNVYANRLSSLLRSIGYSDGKIVNVVAPSSIPLVAAMLGIFKAGNIYLPVDFSSSEKRLKQIFTDTFEGIAIVTSAYKVPLARFLIDQEIDLDYLIVVGEDDQIELYQLLNGELSTRLFEETEEWEHNPALAVTGDNSNYIFYTSGSTGEAKAIEGLHVSLSHFIHWEIREFQIDESFRVSQLTQVTFDASLRDIFTALIGGGTLCIPSQATKTNPALLLSWLQTEKINLVHCVPSLFRLLIKELQAQENVYDSGHLTYLLMAGELLYTKDILNWRKVAGTKTKLVNLYGATETTMIKTFYRIEQIEEIASLPIPVGVPISNTIVAIVKNNNICKAGEIGEIYIKTPFATKGYYKNELLTQAVFVPNPLTNDVKDIVYKTGDLGRYLADGNIEVLGRLDSQVKINGIRVELNEIETAIMELDGISGVVAKSHRTDDNFTSLIAYYTGQERDAEAFRNSLNKVLNQQVIPSYFIYMEEFPLNMNGKVDRKALPIPENIVMGGITFEAPVGELEVTLAKFWKEILGLDKIGRNVSFFSIGGHSLRAIQLAARIQREFGVSIKIADIFLNKTIKELAAFIALSTPVGYKHLHAAPTALSYPLSSAQRRLWVLSQFEGASQAYNMPGAYLFEGDLSRQALVFAFQQLVERHEILRTVFREDDHGNVTQYIQASDVAGFKIGYLDLRDENEAADRLARLVQSTLSKTFNLAEGPLIRANLFQLEDKKWVFTCVMHHIISDGWSMGIFINELLLYYNNHVNGLEFSLAPLRIQYKDYAVWQQEQLGGASLNLHKEYWLNQFKGNLPVIELMTDRPRPAVKTYNGHIVTSKMDQTAVKKFRQLLDREDTTLFMGLVSVLNTLFYRYTGQEDIIIGTPTAGRAHVDLEDQIGFYLNMLALRFRFQAADSFLELLKEVKQVTLSAYEHQIYPFDELVDELQLQRDMSRSALFDVMIILQNMNHDRSVATDQQNDLTVNIYGEQNHVVSKYDLTFNFSGEEDALLLNVEYNTDLFDADTIVRMVDHFNRLLEAVSLSPDESISNINYLSEHEQLQLLETFNDTATDYQEEDTIVDLFRRQAASTPDAIAIVFEGNSFTYKFLDERSDQLCSYLLATHQIETDDLIGVQLDRSEWLVISILGIMKSGAAYIPIDPEYPAERIAYIVSDSRCKAVFDETELSHFKKAAGDWPTGVYKAVKATSLVYCIYTSGTTGNPKGCLLSHKNVLNFFTGMNGVFGKKPGTMLSLTNFTFDISVLELIWTLTLGYQVIIQKDVRELFNEEEKEEQPLAFSLFYFGNAGQGDENDKYKLLLEGAKFADQHDFVAVWTPERHFHEFGGLYPNPSVLGAALSTITNNISIRAGSVVFPLHHPLRIAEEWSVVDNLSSGRVEIACASGWNANDFVFAPENFKKSHEVMYKAIGTVQSLWRGETVAYEDGNGISKDVRIFPRPVRKELPLWITAANSIDTFISAGKMGFNVLTHLLGETVEGLALKIAAYRKAYEECGHDPKLSKVAVMLHTYIGEDLESTYAAAKIPFINYLRTSASLLKNLAADLNIDINAEGFSEEDMDALLEHSFNRYVSSASLIGTKSSCMQMLKKLSLIGVDEIACFIDFGVDFNTTIEGLATLNEIKAAYHEMVVDKQMRTSAKRQLEQYEITHLQATPSMATLLQPYLSKLKSIRTILLGGERLPLSLLKKLYRDLPDIAIYNMYGPTETAIWSTCCKVEQDVDKILIGKPIANTQIYILDKQLNLLPIGTAGEIYIGGKGVAKGYINNPELTAERFIKNPFAPGEHFYRTGDFGKWLSDGNIDYIGRKDDQVKVHGHRIELGEIETVLQQNGLVTAASVIITAEKELVAYVTGTEALNVTDLRAGLNRKLPSYMVPGHYIQVDYLPLTASGKVDKRKLQEMQGRRVETATTYIAPGNEIEKSLELIWKEVLGRDRIGISDNFFDIGGNSIKIVRMIAMVNKKFDKRLSVAMAFKTGNIAALAAYLLAGDDTPDTIAAEEELTMSLNVMEETFSLLNYDTDEE